MQLDEVNDKKGGKKHLCHSNKKKSYGLTLGFRKFWLGESKQI